jgi:hypothetical protein
MNLQEQISRIKQVMRLDEQTQPKQIYLDMGNVLFPSDSSDQGTTERPKDVKGFQSWVINTKKDNQILGRFGADGKWGKNTLNAWNQYGEEYKNLNTNSTTQSSGQDNFIGADLWNVVKNYNPIILSSTGGGDKGETKKESKRYKLTKYLGMKFPDDETNGRVIFVTDKTQKQNYSGPGKILIDDDQKTIDEWNSKRGNGIHHISNQKTLQALNSLMNPTPTA